MRPIRHVLLPIVALAALATLAYAPSAAACESDDGEQPCGDDDHGGSADITLQVKPTVLVDVHQFGGDLHVSTWNQSSIHIKGDFNPACHVDVAPSGDRQEIRLVCSHGPGVGDLEVEIPQGASLDLNTMSADVVVTGVSGASLHAQTITGDVHVHGGAPGEIEISSTSGDVTVESSTPTTRAHSISGDVSVKGVRGRANVRTVSGDVVLSGGEFTSVEVESVSGDVVFGGAVSTQGTVQIQSHSGDVALHLPPTTNADVEMHSMSGDLVIDMGSGRKVADREMVGRIGAGGSRLKLRSFSGDLKITQ